MSHRKPDNERKSKMVSIRLSQSEREKLKTLVKEEGYLSRTRYIRDTILKESSSKQIVVISEPDMKMVKQLKRIGVNLNQANRIYNSLKKEGILTGEGISVYLDQSSKIMEELKKFIEQYENGVSRTKKRS